MEQNFNFLCTSDKIYEDFVAEYKSVIGFSLSRDNGYHIQKLVVRVLSKINSRYQKFEGILPDRNKEEIKNRASRFRDIDH